MRMKRTYYLVVALPVLVTIAAVVGGAAALASAFGDSGAARLFAVIDLFILMALFVNVILLVGWLSIQSIIRHERRHHRRRHRRNQRWRFDEKHEGPKGHARNARENLKPIVGGLDRSIAVAAALIDFGSTVGETTLLGCLRRIQCRSIPRSFALNAGH